MVYLFIEESASWSIINMIDFTQRIVVQDQVEESKPQYNWSPTEINWNNLQENIP